MNRERMERILALAETLDPKKVNMSSWYSTNCQTTACVVGHAAQDPWFIKQGLSLYKGEYSFSSSMPMFEEQFSWEAIIAFFEITYTKADYCFGCRHLKTSIRRLKKLLEIEPKEKKT